MDSAEPFPVVAAVVHSSSLAEVQHSFEGIVIADNSFVDLVVAVAFPAPEMEAVASASASEALLAPVLALAAG